MFFVSADGQVHEVVRQRPGVIWCPVCDYSFQLETVVNKAGDADPVCPGCGMKIYLDEEELEEADEPAAETESSTPSPVDEKWGIVLTAKAVELLKALGYAGIEEVSRTDDETLLRHKGFGDANLKRLREVYPWQEPSEEDDAESEVEPDPAPLLCFKCATPTLQPYKIPEGEEGTYAEAHIIPVICTKCGLIQNSIRDVPPTDTAGAETPNGGGDTP